MIADYEAGNRDEALSSPRQYGIAQCHKHLPEMVKYTGINTTPVFSPVVADFYSGMQVTVPLNIKELKEAYNRRRYQEYLQRALQYLYGQVC